MSRQGLARGIVQAGAIFGAALTKQAEQERQDEIRAEQQAEDRRRFDLQRRDQDIRNENLRMQNMMTQAKMNNEAIVQAGTTSNFDPNVMGQVMSKSSGDKKVFQYDPVKSKAQGGIVYNVGTWEEDANGDPVVDEFGKRVLNSFKTNNGEQRFANQDDHVNWIVDAANPNGMMARINANRTAAVEHKNDLEMFDLKQRATTKLAEKQADLQVGVAEKTGITAARQAQVTSGVAKDKLTAQKVQESKAKEKLLEAQAKDPDLSSAGGTSGTKRDTVFTTPFGKVTLTSQAMTNLRDNRKALEVNFEGITDAETVTLMELKKNAKARKELSAQAKAVRGDEAKTKAMVDRVALKLQVSRSIAKTIVEDEISNLPAEKKWYNF